MTPLLATSIALSIGLVSCAFSIFTLTRWLSRLSERVADLEYPLQARARRKP